MFASGQTGARSLCIVRCEDCLAELMVGYQPETIPE
jgi:hypothetical protein